MSRFLLVLCVAFACAGCARGDNDAKGDTSIVVPEPSAGRTLGIRFEPNAIRVGTPLGELVVDSIDARRAIDSSWVGTARFRGELTLSGRFMRHFDSDVNAVCFEADSTSASRMPRWTGDLRRPWFCFSNINEARAQAPPTLDVPATIVIDRFTIHRGLSDEVNSARLLRVSKIDSA